MNHDRIGDVVSLLAFNPPARNARRARRRANSAEPLLMDMEHLDRMSFLTDITFLRARSVGAAPSRGDESSP